MKVLPLLLTLADGKFRSGEALGAGLNISRAAVWKQIIQLRDFGIDVHSVKGKGYRIPGGIDLLDRHRILSMLESDVAACIGGRFDLQFTTGSTNTDAMSRASSGHSVYLVMTEHQSQGKGRRGRHWVSPFGHNIYMSLLWSFHGGVSALEGLSLTCALMVVRALRQSGTDSLSVKWPNDVLFDERKLAGILMEVSGDAAGHCKVVIGIGVNVGMPLSAGVAIDQPYSDLSGVSEEKPDRSVLAASLVNELVRGLRQFERDGFAGFRQEWLEADLFLGRHVEIIAGNDRTVGTEAGVDEFGRLQLDTANGRLLISGGEMMPSLRSLPPDRHES
jgi:BirA family transcriptional regulator, biotin operon repressor / biotin---[acetyl-CoA-carboxylase] ligase